jgi:TfoX/Sxy family transcriptional regulator of competence genes
MAYDREIESRIRKAVAGWAHTESKKMFGGVCHLLGGHMFCGVYREYLILRLGEEEAARQLQRPYARPLDITGRPMKGWVMVDREGFAGEQELVGLLEKAMRFVSALPPKR